MNGSPPLSSGGSSVRGRSMEAVVMHLHPYGDFLSPKRKRGRRKHLDSPSLALRAHGERQLTLGAQTTHTPRARPRQSASADSPAPGTLSCNWRGVASATDAPPPA